MSYIGKTPTVGNFIKLDDISTSSTNSYTLQHNSVNFSPESANHMLVSLNGVIQAPNTSFSVSGSTITFLPSSGTLSSSDSIDFIMVYGNVLDVGVASTVADASVTKAKMNLISDSSSAGLTIKGDGGSENGTLQLNCSQNSHGVKISSPAHSSGQSYELILPTGNVTADKVLKVASVSGSGTTGIGQLSFGDAGGNASGFLITKSADQTISANTWTQVTLDQEIFDTDNVFASNAFTVPSTGNYYMFAHARINTINAGKDAQIALYKGGSFFSGIMNDRVHANSDGHEVFMHFGGVISLTASDVITLYARVQDNSEVVAGTSGGTPTGIEAYTGFGGFKLAE